MKVIRVPLKNNGYDIYIGSNLEEKIREFFTAADFSRTVLVIADSNTKPIGEKVKTILVKLDFQVTLSVIPAGEQSKSLQVAQDLYTEAIKADLDRKSPIVAVGGGVVGDIGGFIAATYMRGVPFIQVPTSLLADVDSSVGGKVAVNHPQGKNLIGAFYQPKAVFIDLDSLKTLPKREIATGIGEIVKYGLIYNREFFDYIAQHAKDIFAMNVEVLRHIIARACEIKAAVVTKDERDVNGQRAILNFGHTLGHAIERETGYAKYDHGEAVAIGMVGVAYISYKLGFLAEDVLAKIDDILTLCHLPKKCEGCTLEGIYKDLFHDKKTIASKINWILLDAIGKVHVDANVPEDVVRQGIEKIIS